MFYLYHKLDDNCCNDYLTSLQFHYFCLVVLLFNIQHGNLLLTAVKLYKLNKNS